MTATHQDALALTSNTPSVFNFHSQPIRVIMIDDEPWFVAVDVCAALKIANSRDALLKLDGDEKGVGSTDTPGGKQEVAIISESGMYTLVLRCRDAVKPGTTPHQFRKWVTGEVLPSIRKTGCFGDPAKIQHAYALAQAAAGAVAEHVFRTVLSGEKPGRDRWLMNMNYYGKNDDLVPCVEMIAKDAYVLPISEFIDGIEKGEIGASLSSKELAAIAQGAIKRLGWRIDAQARRASV